MFRKTQKSQLLDDAIELYRDGNYVEAYQTFESVLHVSDIKGEIKYCQVYILQCQVKCHSIPLLKLINQVRELQQDLKRLPKAWWVSECEEMIDELHALLVHPKHKAEYAYLSGQKTSYGIRIKNLSNLLKTYPLDLKKPHAITYYINDVCLGLSVAKDLYQLLNMNHEVVKILNLLAANYEAIGDRYVDYSDSRKNKKMWLEENCRGYDPFSSLKNAINYYDMAITVLKNDLKQQPYLKLLFSPLYVAYLATKLMDAKTCKKFFNIEGMIERYSLKQIVMEISDYEMKNHWQNQLDSYNRCAAKIDVKAAIEETPSESNAKKRKAEDQEVLGLAPEKKSQKIESFFKKKEKPIVVISDDPESSSELSEFSLSI